MQLPCRRCACAVLSCVTLRLSVVAGAKSQGTGTARGPACSPQVYVCHLRHAVRQITVQQALCPMELRSNAEPVRPTLQAPSCHPLTVSFICVPQQHRLQKTRTATTSCATAATPDAACRYGKTSQGKLVDTQQLTYLEGLGYDRALAAEALRQVRQITSVASANMQTPSASLTAWTTASSGVACMPPPSASLSGHGTHS